MDVTPSSLVDSYQWKTCCLHLQCRIIFYLKVEAAGYYEIFVSINQTTWHHIPENSNFIVNAMRTSDLT
jgi:hypothetical protein